MQLTRALKLTFSAWVLALALFQFSENTADPDLWGHVVFGREMIHSQSVLKTETFSWTAPGQPFINHEYGFDIILAAVHSLAGGPGILLLKVGMGLLVFWFCLKLGRAGGAAAWGLGALAVVEISYGFAARPQIFTALGIVTVIFALRQIHEDRWKWVVGLPVLFLVWINIHGGALAGVGLLGLAAGATTLQYYKDEDRQKTIIALWLGVLAVITVLFCNPWGVELLRWLIKSLLWFRPEIEEWNPAPLGWDHAALFIVMAISAYAWAFTKRPRALWELAVCAAFAVLALRSVRNAPLFCVVALALVPPHLADALSRWRHDFPIGLKKAAVVLLVLATAGTVAATFFRNKDNPFTMEAPRAKYPIAAVDFIRAHDLKGKMLVFFDWGDLAIAQLPDCPPSIDGRLDACYSRELIKAHWKFYNAEPYDEKALEVNAADLALLPSNLAGAIALGKKPEWQAVYFDDTAVVLVRQAGRFPKLGSLKLPVEGPKAESLGRAAFK